MSVIIDTNVYLSHWPFRKLELDETPKLVSKLRAQGVAEAWAGTFDGLLHKDIASANARLVEECRKYGQGLLVPFGSVNLRLPNWEDDVRRCHEQHKMRGIRIHPNYHGYKLDNPDFTALLKMATERKLLVQLVVLMEDRRVQHPLLPIEPVDLKLLPKIVKEVPGLRLQIQNSLQVLKGELLLSTMAAGSVFFDMATLEGIGGVKTLVQQLPLERVLFGSYAPFFTYESAVLKMKESHLTESQRTAILRVNARKLLA